MRHTDLVLCAAFSLDGKQIVSGSNDRTIHIWDAQMGNRALGHSKCTLLGSMYRFLT